MANQLRHSTDVDALELKDEAGAVDNAALVRSEMRTEALAATVGWADKAIADEQKAAGVTEDFRLAGE